MENSWAWDDSDWLIDWLIESLLYNGTLAAVLVNLTTCLQ